MDGDEGLGPSNRVEHILARDHASVQVGNNDYSRTFHGGTHIHASPSDVTRDTIMRDLASHSYRERKDINPDRVPNTCQWFLSHQRYKQWRQHPASSMLRVSADPGCGKSVLAKYLADEELRSTETSTTCYFFFKDGFGDQSSAIVALRCILHQILSQRSDLFSDPVLRSFQQRSYLLTSTVELWDVIVKVSSDPAAGEIILILDAFDECTREGRIELEKVICKFYGHERQEPNLKLLVTGRPYEKMVRGLRGLELSDLPVLHLAGEDEDEARLIAEEIDLVIAARVSELAIRLDLDPQEAEYLQHRLTGFKNRTYLWVYLTLEVIESADKTNQDGISTILDHLPQSVYDAYEKILDRSSDAAKARKLLQVMIAATRPLSLTEMAVVLELEEHHKQHSQLHVTQESKVQGYLRDLCGLFIVVINAEVFFLHQTAREFLIRDEEHIASPEPPNGSRKGRTGKSPGSKSDARSAVRSWAHTITLRDAHGVMSKLCAHYLLLLNDIFVNGDADYGESRPDSAVSIRNQAERDFPFLQYSSRSWYQHCRKYGADAVPLESVLRLCGDQENGSPSFFWISALDPDPDSSFDHLTPLMVASNFGLTKAVQSLLATSSQSAKAVNRLTRRSALSYASEQGFVDIVEILLGHFRVHVRRIFGRANKHVDNIDWSGQTPLSYAALNGHTAVARLLLKAGARPWIRDHSQGTPTFYGLCSEDEDMVKLMLHNDTRTDQNHMNSNLAIILYLAIFRGQDRVISRIIKTGLVKAYSSCPDEKVPESEQDFLRNFDHFVIDFSYNQGRREQMMVVPRTLAQFAALTANQAFFKAFDDIGDPVDVQYQDAENGSTLLHWAVVGKWHIDGFLQELLSRGAIIDQPDNIASFTPLHWALWRGDPKAAQLLVRLGASHDNVTKDGRSASRIGFWPFTVSFHLDLHLGIPGLEGLGTDEIRQLSEFVLSETEVNFLGLFDNDSWFSIAAEDLLRTKHTGAQENPGMYAKRFHMPLMSWHYSFWHREGFELRHLILAAACIRQHPILEALVRATRPPLHNQLMLQTGNGEVEVQDHLGRTLLHTLPTPGHALLLLRGGADPNAQDEAGRTPLHDAVLNLHGDLVHLLLQYKADASIQDQDGATALHECIEAAKEPTAESDPERVRLNEFDRVLKLLLEHREAVNVQDKKGQTALHRATILGVTYVVRWLVEAGADVSARDLEGNTPLHFALAKGHRDIGDVLLECAADRSALNNAGQPPMINSIGFGKSGKFRWRKKVDGPRGS